MRKSLMDTEVLQRLQNQFCNANDIYLVCLNRDREVLASCQCADETIQFFSERISRDSVSDLLSSVELSQVEAVMEEALELPYLKLCSVVTRVEGATALIWIAIAVLKEHISEDLMLPESIRVTTEERFYRTIALLEEVSKQLMRGKEQEQLANEALEQSVASESKCKEQMLRSEAMATIVHMLGSDDAFSYVANAVIQEICKVLHIEGGCLVRDNADGIHLDVLCEYTQSRSWSLANRLHGQKRSAFPFGDGRAYMLSSDSMMPDEMEEFFRQFHLQAGLFHPIEVNGADSMYLCLYEFEKTRTWTVDDIKFISDIKKVLQTILARRIVKNSLAGSYAS
jgi:hypothetical protein